MKGPKTLLAEAIAAALEEFFVVDQIDSQLLSNAAVKLHNTELKPRNDIPVSAPTKASIRGIVKYVAFEWHWGRSDKEGGSDLVKDTSLILQGLDFTISLEKADMASSHQEASSTSAQDAPKEDPKETANRLMRYAQDQIERIMDTLTLKIQDCTVTVVLPDKTSKLEFGFAEIELRSMGHQEGLPLLQELFLQGMHLNAIVDAETFPILNDITYSCRTERTFGTRFSSLDRGVEVMGESNDDGIVVTAGKNQIEVVSKLIDVMLEGVPPSAGSATSDEGNERDSYIQRPDSNENPTLTERKESEGDSSYIQLPLAGVTLILPNDAKITLSDIVLKYQMDSTIFSIEGQQGVTVNNKPFFQLGETSIWIADFTTSEFRVEDPAIAIEDAVEDEVVAYFRASSEDLNVLLGGVTEILGIRQKASEKQDENVAKIFINTAKRLETSGQDTDEQPSWSVHVNGVIGCLYEQEADTDIELTLSTAKFDTETMCMITKIKEFHYPGNVHLARTVEEATFKYDADKQIVSAAFSDVVVIFDGDKEVPKDGSNRDNKTNIEEEMKGESDTSPGLKQDSQLTPSSSNGSTLPCGLHLDMSKFLAFKSDAKSIHTTIEKLKLSLDPAASESNPDDKRTIVAISVDEVNHDMIRLQEPKLHAILVLLSDSNTISSFHFGAKTIYAAAGYSFSDWKGLLPKKKAKQIEKKAVYLPYAKVDKLKIVALLKGVIGVKNSVVNVDTFNGTETTTLDDLIKYYSKNVTSQVPSMFVNAEVMGTSVTDNALIMLGGGVGGIVSVAAFDGVRNTIKEGKVARGVEDTDEWRFSDIATGLKHAAVRATRQGAAKRGKDGDSGNVVDWTVGATADATQYIGENKSRFAGAGAGAAAFGVGLALGGPVGAILGTLVANAATQKTVEIIDETTKKITIGDNSVIVHDINASAKEEQVSKNSIIFSGILLKRLDFIHWEWRTYYFILRKGSLAYCVINDKPPGNYKGRKADIYYDSSKPQKSLEFVNHYVTKDSIVSNPEKNSFVFSIFSLESKSPLWTLAASTEELRDQWVSAISNVMSSTDGNDVRRTRVSLRSSSVAELDPAKREDIRNSLPAALKDLL